MRIDWVEAYCSCTRSTLCPMLSLVPCNKMSKNINRCTLEEFCLPNFNCELFRQNIWVWMLGAGDLHFQPFSWHSMILASHCNTQHCTPTLPHLFISTSSWYPPQPTSHCLSNQSESKTTGLQVIDASAIKQRLTYHMLKTMDGIECYNWKK